MPFLLVVPGTWGGALFVAGAVSAAAVAAAMSVSVA